MQEMFHMVSQETKNRANVWKTAGVATSIKNIKNQSTSMKFFMKIIYTIGRTFYRGSLRTEDHKHGHT